MEWMDWMGKRIFLRTKSGKVYSGEVIDIDENQSPVIFLTIIDKFDERVMIITSEISELKEEKEYGAR